MDEQGGQMSIDALFVAAERGGKKERVVVPVGDHRGKDIFIAADHRGFELKQRIIDFLLGDGYSACVSIDEPLVMDMGCHTTMRCHYPVFAKEVASSITHDPFEDTAPESVGILVCGSGIGIGIPAMKYRGVLADRCLTVEDAVAGREYGNTNLLVLGADRLSSGEIPKDYALEIVKAWLDTAFSPSGKKDRRVQQYIQKVSVEREALSARHHVNVNASLDIFTGAHKPKGRRIVIGADPALLEIKNRLLQNLNYGRSALEVLSDNEHLRDISMGSGVSLGLDRGEDGAGDSAYISVSARIGRAISCSFGMDPSEQTVGIALSISGKGMALPAGKFSGVYPAVCVDVADAASSRQHNNANMLCLPGDKLSLGQIARIIDVWLSVPFGVSEEDKPYVDRFKQTLRIEHDSVCNKMKLMPIVGLEERRVGE